MKAKYLVILILGFVSLQSRGQVVNGTLSQDWTLSDINGVSHNLYTYLNAGKTVFIDISATWCNPCWDYHHSGAFDSIWTFHGPSGEQGVSASTTNDCIVLFFEGDVTTNYACLIGDMANCNASTEGDWTTGVNYPIFDLTTSTTPTVDEFNALYNLTYFPTCVMICPDRSMTEVDFYSATQLYAATLSCTIANQPDDARILSFSNLSLTTCDSIIPPFLIGNMGIDTLTSATVTFKVDGTTQKTLNWTGSLTTYATTGFIGIKVGASTLGTHTLTVIVSNPNGGADPTPSNDSVTTDFFIYPTVGGAYISQSFENGGIPTDWDVTAGGSFTWANATTGFNSLASVLLQWPYTDALQVDYLTLPPMSFAGATVASLTFDIAHAHHGDWYSSIPTNKLEVQVSTDCGLSWTDRYSKADSVLETAPTTNSPFIPSNASEWRHEVVNLTTFAGQQQVLVRFKATTGAFGNNLYIDNINFAATTGIDENTMKINNVNVYPNPIVRNTSLNFSLSEPSYVTVTFVDMLGQVIINKDLGIMETGVHNYPLETGALTNGFYLLNVKTDNTLITTKVAVNK